MDLETRQRFSKDNAVEASGQEARTGWIARFDWEPRGWPRTPNPAARRGAGIAREIRGCWFGDRKVIGLVGMTNEPLRAAAEGWKGFP